MGTESHGGDGGLLEDGEDEEDGEDTITLTGPVDTERRAASGPAAELRRLHHGGEGGGKGGSDFSASAQVSNVPLETLRGI